MKISNVTNMANGRSKTKKSYRMEISRYPIVKKEIRLIFRNPQNVFSISYAIIFPVVMAYVNKSAMSGAMFVGIFAAIYAANLALQLIAEEKKIWPMPKLLPIDMGRTLQYKAAIPAMIFTLGYGVVLLFSYFMLNMNPLMFLSIIPMTAVLLYSSLFGLSLFLNDPQRGMTGKTIAFKFKEALMLEFNTMLLAFGIIFPFNMLSEGGLLEVLMGEWWYKLIAIGLPWIIMVIVIFLVKRTFRKINMKVGAWE
jgi:ABC-2 type transport system permease protein